MTQIIKDLGKLEKDIIANSSGSLPVVVLDTGGLIDIVQSARQYGLNYKNGNRDSKYAKVTSFLKSLSERTPVIITPKTYQEMQDHGRMMLNAHITELSPRVVDFALQTMLNSQRFMDTLQLERGELDQTRYDAYWASREGCNDNKKKHEEGCSDTDKEILSVSAYLSKCKVLQYPNKRVGQILVLSSDAHILQGIEFLKRGFDGQYSNIVPISTRH